MFVEKLRLVVSVVLLPLVVVVVGLMAAPKDVQVIIQPADLHPMSRLAALHGQGPSRMMASKAMTTYVVYRTTIPTCSFTTSCAITNGAVTACRRLDREVDIDAILPNKPIK
jgi:hypothetical protein